MAIAGTREAHAGDAEAIADVLVRCWREAYPALVPSFMLASLKVVPRWQWLGRSFDVSDA